MATFVVEVFKKGRQPFMTIGSTLVTLEINFFVFPCPPQAFDHHVVDRVTATSMLIAMSCDLRTPVC